MRLPPAIRIDRRACEVKEAKEIKEVKEIRRGHHSRCFFGIERLSVFGNCS